MRMNFNALNGNVSREGKMFDEAISIPTYISLCSGYDGIGRGLERVIPNLRTIAHCEIEAYAIANLIAKMEEGQLDACPVFTDIKQFPFRELRGKVTILSAGFPCQPFSSAGKRQATEDPRHLWPWIANGVSAMRPEYCFFENVPGIISSTTADGESVLKYVLRDLEQRGYKCTWGIFSAHEIGAAHQRKRVFILAYRADFGQQWSGRSNKESSSHTIEGCGDGASSTREVLGNSTSLRPHRGSENCEGEQSEVLGERLESDAELANPTSRQPRQSQARNGGQDTSGGSEDTQWPARPGEEQYEWEEPRVVADSKSRRSRESGDKHKERERCESNRGSSEGCDTDTKIESFMGGATHGTQHRVDRLRLLGNGVVPQTAELAWRTLWKEMDNGN